MATVLLALTICCAAQVPIAVLLEPETIAFNEIAPTPTLSIADEALATKPDSVPINVFLVPFTTPLPALYPTAVFPTVPLIPV